MPKLNRNKIYVFTAKITIQMIFEANPHRKAFLILNNGANIVEFLDNINGAYGSGFPLSPGYPIDDDHFNPQDALYVIAMTGDTELRVWEILSEREE